MEYLSDTLKAHEHVMGCLIEQGGFTDERNVRFPSYDDNGIGCGVIGCHPMYVDEEKGLCRVDVTTDKGDSLVVHLVGEIHRVPADNVFRNRKDHIRKS